MTINSEIKHKRKSEPEKEDVNMIIFYCEFSSERGPKMYNFFRSIDRRHNKYPRLHYPHIYLLKGGYCQFHQDFRNHCSIASKEHIKIKKDNLKKIQIESILSKNLKRETVKMTMNSLENVMSPIQKVPENTNYFSNDEFNFLKMKQSQDLDGEVYNDVNMILNR